ncbi:MAG: hypothetical protein GY938_29430 [Ketobacter sp.]|nr:hypothetical protein [Ketobacter sp.]
MKDPEHPITAATPLASPEPLKPEPLKPAPSKPAPTPAPSKPESSEPEEGSESESSENAFYYDEAYKEYKEQLHEAQMEKLREVYAGLSNCELKMVIEMMSDAVVEKSKK